MHLDYKDFGKLPSTLPDEKRCGVHGRMYGMSCDYAIIQAVNKGYTIIQSNFENIVFMVRKEYGNQVYILGIVDHVQNKTKIMSPEELESIAAQLEWRYQIENIENKIELMYIIFTDYVDREKVYAQGNFNFWIMDTLGKQLIIFENQRDDFDGFREDMENYWNQRQNKDSIKKKFPIVTILMIMMNVLVFFWLEYNYNLQNKGVVEDGQYQYIEYMLEHGASYAKNIFEQGEYYRLVTAMFLHFGFVHLFNNMFILLIIGSQLEKYTGHLMYFVIYTGSGLIGNLLSAVYWYHGGASIVSAGASSAVYGVLGGIVTYILSSLHIHWMNKSHEERGIEIRGDFSAVIRILLVSLLLFRGGENVDMLAHVGGFFGGMLLTKIVSDIQRFNRNHHRLE